MKKVVILGSTGTIGLKALEVIKAYKNDFVVSVLVANKSWELLKKQIEEFRPERALLMDYESFQILKNELNGNYGTQLCWGMESLKEILELHKRDIILSAFSGTAGIRPTYWSVENGSYVALANKESLVSAGDIIIPLAKRTGATLIPIDSEHSAIFQLLEGKDRNEVKKIILPASGGPFLEYSYQDLDKVTISDALNHPVWKMGKKITVDSATLANKGLEVIEAHHLFSLSYDSIEVVIHPQCLIHGIVEMKDGAFFAHLSEPDMRHPIAYALFYPKRIETSIGAFYNFVDKIEVRKVDHNKFPLLNLAYEVGRLGSSFPAVFNIADELAVNAFLSGKIAFTDIYKVVYKIIENHKPIPINTLEDIEAVEKETVKLAENIIKKVN